MTQPTAAEIARAVRAGERSPVEVVEAALERIEATREETNAFITVTAERARERARDLEARIEAGEDPGPLAGVPVAIKDLSETVEGVPNTMGIAPLSENVADHSSPTVERLIGAGAVVVGTTNTPELGHTPRTYNELLGPTPTPFDPDYNAGGSSGGSAAALAAGLVPLATGSDVGGSLRVPASCCGVASVKPTFGVVPKDTRPNAFTSHTPFGVLGPMARSVEDLALMLSTLAGRDDRDPFSAPVAADYPVALERPVDDLRVAYSPDLGIFPVEEGVSAAVEDRVEALSRAGASVEEAPPDLPPRGELVYAFGVSATVNFAVVARSLEARFDLDFAGEDAGAVSDTFVQTLALGQGHDALDYRGTDEARTAVYDAVESLFEAYDALVCPVCTTPPLTHDEPYPTEIAGERTSGLPTDWNLAWPFNMSGHPVVTVPAGLVDGLPVGLQVVTRRFEEGTGLALAAAIEREKPWAGEYPR
jgi:amidase